MKRWADMSTEERLEAASSDMQAYWRNQPRRQKRKRVQQRKSFINLSIAMMIIFAVVAFVNQSWGKQTLSQPISNPSWQQERARPAQKNAASHQPKSASSREKQEAQVDASAVSEPTVESTADPAVRPTVESTRASAVRRVMPATWVNLRPRPHTSDNKIETVDSSHCYEVLGIESGESIYGNTTWYKVKHRGQIGYITAYYVKSC